MGRRLLDDVQRRDWLRLILSENVGPITFRQLINRFGSAKEALHALPELARRGGMQRPIRICPADVADRHLANVSRIGARLVAIGEAEFPPLLREVDHAPPMLCVKGNTALVNQPMVAIVGARNASALGRKFARKLASDLGATGFVIASGLARGIDTAAHEASLATGTIAVLAGGIDNVYPPENRELYEAIGERGILIAEMMPGVVPKAESFPRRNRIISGMTYGTVVVEAALRSGSLITARFATEQGRDVFAVPGSPLDPRAGGTNRLLRDGATIVENASDIVEQLKPQIGRPIEEKDAFMKEDRNETLAAESLDGHEQSDARARILELLGPSPVEVDDLVRESGLPTAAVLATLLELELAGLVSRHRRNQVSLA